MKYLQPINGMFESSKDSFLQGFYFMSNMTSIYFGAYPTFTQFGNGILNDFGVEPENKILTWGDLDNEILETLDYGAGREFESQVWSGLIPKSSEPFLDGTGHNNPHLVVRMLKNRFVNSEKIMTSNPSGNDGKLDYIIKSIYGDPNLFSDYIRHEDDDVKNYVLKNMGAEQIAQALNGDILTLSKIYKDIKPKILKDILDIMGISKDQLENIKDVENLGLI